MNIEGLHNRYIEKIKQSWVFIALNSIVSQIHIIKIFMSLCRNKISKMANI